MTLDVLKLRQPSRARLVDDVYRSLEEAILAGRMRPGDRLIETWIAEQLNVSRTTVREALLMLERQGFVVSEPRRGTFVTRLSDEDALDLSYNRVLLETFALRTGFARIDARMLNDMADCILQMQRCRLPDDVPRLIQIDQAFHRPLVEAAGSRRLTEMWASLNGQIGALFLRGIERQHASAADVAEVHQQVLDTIIAGDAAAAQQAIIGHYIRPSERDIVRNMQMLELVGVLSADYRDDFHPEA